MMYECDCLLYMVMKMPLHTQRQKKYQPIRAISILKIVIVSGL